MRSNEIPFKGKKAFSLLELVISITIFMIILLFLYKSLDDTKLANKKFENHLHKKDDLNHLYKVIAEDIAESDGVISLSIDRDKNSIVTFKTNNSFNDAFFRNVAYMISSNNHLLRIESKEAFKKEKSGIDFYNNSFIDILSKDIKKFVVLQKDNDKFVFIIEPKKGEKIMFPTFKMEN